ncbi:alpha/beta fold hydrolase [Micromonospora sp. NPDC049282]|uniref:alpha/beta fold hydrolase n=1 Tax=Micromonospora sp. NPDC049282 TaxID=3364269 RepID=UPI00371837DF
MISTLPLADTTLRYSVTTPAAIDRAVPILLLHPWFGCRAFWDPVADDLGARCYAVDWYSLSHGAWTDWASPEGLARAAIALVDHLDLDSVDVVGNSVGGIVAQLLAARSPERVRRLVLVGTGASLGGPPTAFGELVSAWIAGTQDRRVLAARLVDALVATPPDEPQRNAYVRAVLDADPGFVSAVLTAARGLDLRPELQRITAPTLVIRGEHDSARTPEHVATLIAGLPDASAVEMSGCGHSPMIEQPATFATLVRRHLAA